MAENDEFMAQLQKAIGQKTEWFNSTRLPELLNQYRILQSCTKNLYEVLVKKSLIIQDPYRRDKKIQDVVVPDTSSFTDNEASSVLGTRFSEYQVMLDFVCTYYRFTIDTFQIPVVKKLLELNKVFNWDDFTTNSQDSNTRALASVIAESKNNTPAVIISMIQDSVDQNGSSFLEINQILNEAGAFQKELYKLELRKGLFEHPEFNKEKAFTSAEAELAEIKRLYTNVMGNAPFYADLVKEIINEDVGANKEAARAKLLQSLAGGMQASKKSKRATSDDMHDLALDAVLCVAASAPTLSQLRIKLCFNTELLGKKSSGFFGKLAAAIKKIFGAKNKEKICSVDFTDPKTGAVRTEKINITELIIELNKKEKLYSSIAMKGPEFTKIDGAPNESIISFVSKQISELQTCFTKLNGLDGYFKVAVDVMEASKVKGMQIELSALRNSIMNANKKRGEYSATVEEKQQMQNLGVSENENN